MEFVYEIYRLSDTFYCDYDKTGYPEILEKEKRAYNCLILKMKEDYYACVPYRTEINHDNAYHFKTSARSRMHKSGLDYSKMVIVREEKYLGSPTVIDSDEYKETRDNINVIAKQVDQYIDEYIAYQRGTSMLAKRELRKKFHYTTLRYFHPELNI